MSYNLAFYTCFIGSNENDSFLIPPLPSYKYPCIYFTNNPEATKYIVGTGWKFVLLDIPITNHPILDCMNCKEIRSCPHRFDELKDFDYVCWFDTKLKVDEEKIETLIDELEKNNKSIVLSKHPYQFETVWGEYFEAIKYPRYVYESRKYHNYIESKIKENGTDKLNVHYCGGFSIRKLKDKDGRVIKYNEEWYQNILQCGIEDQISLQFVHQNYTDIILGIEYKACWDYSYDVNIVHQQKSEFI